MTEKTNGLKCIAAVRIRGTVRGSKEARETLEMLHLSRNNYVVLVDDSPSFLGMLKAAQNFITWGEASEETIQMLLKEKGKSAGNKKLTDDYLKKLDCKSIKDLADAIMSGQLKYWKLPNIQPVFKLHPPIKGFKGKVKKSVSAGGELGYRGEEINKLVKRML